MLARQRRHAFDEVGSICERAEYVGSDAGLGSEWVEKARKSDVGIVGPARL